MFGFENQAPWTQAALQSILGAQQEQPQVQQAQVQQPQAGQMQMPSMMQADENTQKTQQMPSVGGMQPGPNQQMQMAQAPNTGTNGSNDPMMIQDKQMQDMFKGIFGGGGMFGG